MNSLFKERTLQEAARFVTGLVAAVMLVAYVGHAYFFTPKSKIVLYLLEHYGWTSRIAWLIVENLSPALTVLSYAGIALILYSLAVKDELAPRQFIQLAILVYLISVLKTPYFDVFYVLLFILTMPDFKFWNARVSKAMGATKQFRGMLKKHERKIATGILVLSVLPAAVLPFAIKIENTGSIWWHYRNALEIYEHGAPVSDLEIPDTRFLFYPPLGHAIAAYAKEITQESTMLVLKYLFSIFGILTILLVYAIGASVWNRGAGALSAFFFGYTPLLMGTVLVGAYSQVASNLFALCAIYALVLFEKHKKDYLMALSTVFVALTVQTHWLVAIPLIFVYLAYAYENKRMWFVLLLLIATLPYLLQVSSMQGLLKGTLNQFNPVPSGNVSLPQATAFDPYTLLNEKAGILLIALGLVGLVKTPKSKKAGIIRNLFNVSLGILIALYLFPTFYVDRPLYYVAFFFSFFVGAGGHYLLKGVQKQLESKKDVFLVMIFLILAAYGLASFLASAKAEMSESIFPITGSDWAGVFWLNENTHNGESVASDTSKTRFLYGFTKGAKFMRDDMALQFFEENRPEKGLNPAFLFVSNENRLCRFPCADRVELKKDESLVKRWESLEYPKIRRELDSAYLKVFSENNATIYRT